MASGDDPLADMQNLIGYQGLVGQNPYLTYQGKIPMAGFYTGDAGQYAADRRSGESDSELRQRQQLGAAAVPAGDGGLSEGDRRGRGAPGTTLNNTGGSAGGTFDYSKMGSAGAPRSKNS